MYRLSDQKELLPNTNLDSPRTLGVDHDEWRLYQPEAINYVGELDRIAKYDGETQYFILEAPTGSGKTCVPVASGNILGVSWTGITVTTDLQDQYTDLYNIPSVKGKSRYPCVCTKWTRAYRSLHGNEEVNGVRQPTTENCYYLVHKGKMSECGLPCPYNLAKYKAISSPGMVLNIHYAYLTRFWREGTRLLVIDEVHRLAPTLSSLNERIFTGKARERFGWPKFPELNGSSINAITQAAHWIRDVSTIVRNDHQIGHDDDLKAYRRKIRADRLKALASSMYGSRKGDYHIQIGEDMTVRCADVTMAKDKLMESVAPRVVLLMSATIGNPLPIANRLGLPLDRTWFHTVPATFPPENRPVYFWTDAPKINYKTPESEWQRVADTCRYILGEHGGERGIIHTSSWYQAEMMKRMIGSSRCYLPEGSRSDSIAQFKNGRENAVVISPSWKEGIDLPDDDCRFSIVVKINFAPWKDPVVQLRVRQPGGKAEYDWQASLDLVQAAGRMVRHEDDYGTCYILDANWRRVMGHAPVWFEVQNWNLS